MATIAKCPACGEKERLLGRPAGDGIEVTCETCGARWMRGAARCNGCGGEDVVARPQVMTRHPRGNQLAIVGRRQLPLCPHCDAEAIATSSSTNRPVPETYVSVFLFGHDKQLPRPADLVRPGAGLKDAPVDLAERRRRRDSRSTAAAGEPGSAPRRGAIPRRPASRPSSPEPTVQPTFRQAIETFLATHPDADSLTMVLLGQHLGPATRLAALERPGAAEELRQWFDATWSERHPARRQAAVTICAAVDHWRGEQWLAQDLASALRQHD
ncbi:MAG: hypothetical protein ACOYX5_07970 [Actinomycetota bacterium]